jgi:hypothetical protein
MVEGSTLTNRKTAEKLDMHFQEKQEKSSTSARCGAGD